MPHADVIRCTTTNSSCRCSRRSGYSQQPAPAPPLQLPAASMSSSSAVRCPTPHTHPAETPPLKRTSEPQEKLPWSRRSARNLLLPPRTRTRRTHTLEDSLVIAAWRPSSNLQSGARVVVQGAGQRGRRRPAEALSIDPCGASILRNCATMPFAALRGAALTSASCAMPSACRRSPGACAASRGRYLQRGCTVWGSRARCQQHSIARMVLRPKGGSWAGWAVALSTVHHVPVPPAPKQAPPAASTSEERCPLAAVMQLFTLTHAAPPLAT